MNTALTPDNGKRNALRLASLQALGSGNNAIVFALGGLAGQRLASSPDLATLPISLYSLGLALGTIPAAVLLKRLGRRFGYTTGALIGLIGAAISVMGLVQASFMLFCLGVTLTGLYSAYIQNYRFAAADSATADFRPRAIAWVMAGGLFGAIIGPQTVIQTREIWTSTPYASSFLAQGALALLTLPLIFSLRPPPARSTGHSSTDHGRPLWLIARSPAFFVAAIAGVVSFSLMNFIMTASPLAMVHHGHSVEDATLGIQWHVLAMFAPSFFTGSLIQRFGRIPVTITGLLLIGVAGALALSGQSLTHFWAALIALGLGWNFGFIGATALVAESYRPEEKNRVQGLNDFLVFGCVAISSFSSGRVLALHGWATLNELIYTPIAVSILLLLWLWRRDTRSVMA